MDPSKEITYKLKCHKGRRMVSTILDPSEEITYSLRGHKGRRMVSLQFWAPVRISHTN